MKALSTQVKAGSRMSDQEGTQTVRISSWSSYKLDDISIEFMEMYLVHIYLSSEEVSKQFMKHNYNCILR